MKIACVHAQIRLGGADRRLIDLANVMARKGHEVSLYLLSEDNYQGFEIHPDIHVECIAQKSVIPKTQLFSNMFALRKKLKEDQIDLAISFAYPISIQLLIARKGTKVKTLISERGNPDKQPGGGLWKRLRDKTYPKTDGIVFQTQGARQYYVEHIGLDGRVIHNPVDVGSVEAKPSGNKIIAHVGRLDGHKNQHRLLYAFSVFIKSHPEYRLRICGDGHLEQELKEYAIQLGIQDRIIWMGNVEEPYSAIAQDDFFVLSSDFEGMPNALMEAMAVGLPCISSDCVPGGARELIDHGENGLLCKLDKGEDMADKMTMLADDAQLATRIGQKAGQLRQTHSSENIYAQWMAYIEEITQK